MRTEVKCARLSNYDVILEHIENNIWTGYRLMIRRGEFGGSFYEIGSGTNIGPMTDAFNEVVLERMTALEVMGEICCST